MRRAPRAITLLALAALLALGFSLPARAQESAPVEPRASLPDIEDEVMCPVCGVPLEHAIDAPQAVQQRELIRGLIAEGQTKDQIKDRLVAEFGPEVLAIPEAEGFDLAAWLVPGAAILAAAVAIAFALRRWRRAGPRPGSSASASDSEAVDGEAGRRLARDLSRYEL